MMIIIEKMKQFTILKLLSMPLIMIILIKISWIEKSLFRAKLFSVSHEKNKKKRDKKTGQ